jgi:hypothetical protein
MKEQSFVIEVDDTAAGVVVAIKDGYQFHAASKAFARIDRWTFKSPGHAEDMCRSLSSRRAPSSGRLRIEESFGDLYGGRQTEYLPEGGIPYGFPFVFAPT